MSPKVNQKYNEEDATSQKRNVVKQNVFIEYRGIATDFNHFNAFKNIK